MKIIKATQEKSLTHDTIPQGGVHTYLWNVLDDLVGAEDALIIGGERGLCGKPVHVEGELPAIVDLVPGAVAGGIVTARVEDHMRETHIAAIQDKAAVDGIPGVIGIGLSLPERLCRLLVGVCLLQLFGTAGGYYKY